MYKKFKQWWSCLINFIQNHFYWIVFFACYLIWYFATNQNARDLRHFVSTVAPNLASAAVIVIFINVVAYKKLWKKLNFYNSKEIATQLSVYFIGLLSIFDISDLPPGEKIREKKVRENVAQKFNALINGMDFNDQIFKNLKHRDTSQGKRKTKIYDWLGGISTEKVHKDGIDQKLEKIKPFSVPEAKIYLQEIYDAASSFHQKFNNSVDTTKLSNDDEFNNSCKDLIKGLNGLHSLYILAEKNKLFFF